MSTTAPPTDPWAEILGPSTCAELEAGLNVGVDELVEQLQEDAARLTKPGEKDPHANNPSKTTTIQQKYAQKLRGRFAAIRTEIRRGVSERDVLELADADGSGPSLSDLLAEVNAPDEVCDRFVELLAAERYDAVGDFVEQLRDEFDPEDLIRRDFEFDSLSRKHREFMRWLRRQQEQGVLEIIGPDDNPYVRSAYERGYRNAGTWMDEPLPDADVAAALRRPIHRDRLDLLYTRNFEALQGITENVSREISRELAEGLAEGDGADAMARRLTDRIDAIGRTRATTLARTEVMYSHNEAVISTYEQVLGADVDIEIVGEVATAADQHVCEVCDPWHGETIPLENARSEGPPFHPRCRCVLIPAKPEDRGNVPDEAAAVSSGAAAAS